MGQAISRRRIFRDRVLPAVGMLAVLAVSGGLGWRAWGRAERPVSLRITGGRLPGPRQRLAEVLAREARSAGIALKVVECTGSIEALDRVESGRVELALVQGGLDSRRWGHVRQVAALHVEPLQLVVRGDLAAEVAANLRALQGHSINLSEVGTGSHALAREVLGFVGLREGAGGPGRFRATTMSHQQLEAIRIREGLPDAVLTVAALPTPAVRHLVDRWGYRLVGLPFGQAFALESLEGEGLAPARVNPSADRAVIDKVHLSETTIPAYTYGVEPAVPAVPLPTFGARLLVVANQGVEAGAVERLLETIYLGQFAEVARPPLASSLLDLPAEFPPHPGMVAFSGRNKPLIVGDAVDFLEKASSLAGALITGAFFLWQWARRNYRRRLEIGFEAYLLRVTDIEGQALRFELAARLDLAALLALQADLGRVKDEAIRRFTSGDLEGDGLISGFLTHANDARDYLARLILHARTAIEKQARRQGLSPESAWDLAIGGDAPAIDGHDGGRPLPSGGPVL